MTIRDYRAYLLNYPIQNVHQSARENVDAGVLNMMTDRSLAKIRITSVFFTGFNGGYRLPILVQRSFSKSVSWPRWIASQHR